MIVYLILAVTFGYTMLTTDLVIGRKTGRSAVLAYASIRPKWKSVGVLVFIVPALVMSYYGVIGGWVSKYTVSFLTGQVHQSAQDGYFSQFISSPVEPAVYGVVFVFLTTLIVCIGVNEGIENSARVIMPVLAVMMVGVSLFALTLRCTDEATGEVRTALDGLAVYLIPNFNGMTPERFFQILLDAMVQLFFSLGIAMGIMVTYGSYVKKDVDLSSSINYIEIFDTGIALLAGLIVIPTTYAFSGVEGMTSGPGLLFISLTKIFDTMGGIGTFVGAIFFIAAFFAALTSSVCFIEPTLNVILGIITAVAGPMVFFSLTWGVCTIGDVETLSRIGKRMIGRFMAAQLLLAAAAVVVCLPFFRSSAVGSSLFQPAEIYVLLLGIIPDNLVTPFTTGNTEHIITLAVVAGIVLLLLGERVSALTTFVDHMNKALTYLMTGASALIPFMVFFGLFKIAANGQFSVVLQSWKIVVTILALFVLPMLIYIIMVAIRKRVSVLKLIRKASSVFIIGLMTASSSAALTENLERCRESYGIDDKIVGFGVPLGQTIFMPGAAMFFISISFGMAENYDIAMTPNWLILVALTSVLLAVALPPIPGGMTMCFTILFGQLSIPSEAIGIALALNIIFEYAVTSVNLVCLQLELTELAGSLDMLDLETLRKA